MGIIILDGPMGTELRARGMATELPLWSARALLERPELVREIHFEYAAAGATVHTTNTFRTRRRTMGAAWADAARLAVRLTREAVPATHRVAGSVAPLADCYRPDLSPADSLAGHRELAELLAASGVDLLLCETFPHVGEALAAARACLETGVKTWVSFTAGPDADLLKPEEIRRGAEQAVELGASAVLVNCVPAARTMEFVCALAGLGVPFGAYANAGRPDEQMGWTNPDAAGASVESAARRYAEHAETWVGAGATIVGGCCGTGPAHIRRLAGRL